MSLYGFTQDYKRNQAANRRLENSFTGTDLEIAKKIKSNVRISRNYAIIMFQFGILGAIILGFGSTFFLPKLFNSDMIQFIVGIIIMVIGFIIGYWIGKKIYSKRYEARVHENKDLKKSHPELYVSVTKLI